MRLKNQRFFMWFNKIIFPFFYLRHQGKQTIIVNGDEDTQFTVRVNTSDILVIWEIWKAKIYDDARFPIREEDVVVDIGGHIGGFAVRAAKLAHRGQVYAYEASSKNYAVLEKNLQLNNTKNLHSHNQAVSHQSGKMKFFMPSDNGALGSLLQETDSPMETVQATTLPEIITENNIQQIDYLKMDVEGAEYDILFKCPADTLKKVKCIVMEYHEFEGDQRDHHDLIKVLQSNGFHVEIEDGIFPQKFLFGTGIIKAWRD
ncbi:MAG TPA: FkbM family methyltransferase [Anaerolineales bacterium]|nr:FkbM family methyltransferase [Anaerolineales bacterium]